MDIKTKLRLIKEGYSLQESNENFNFPMQQWKDENPTIYKKKQLKTEINRLKRENNYKQDSEITRRINDLEKEYNAL